MTNQSKLTSKQIASFYRLTLSIYENTQKFYGTFLGVDPDFDNYQNYLGWCIKYRSKEIFLQWLRDNKLNIKVSNKIYWMFYNCVISHFYLEKIHQANEIQYWEQYFIDMHQEMFDAINKKIGS